MRRPLIVLLALSVSPAERLSAQSPTERAAIETLRDSLARVTDSLSLQRLEAATIQVAKQHRADPLVHVRLGFIAHRLGEIANTKSHYDAAAGEFEWAAELRPDWPYPWYGLGLAELAQGEHAVIAIENLRQQLGKDYLSKAARALARATQADASFAQASIDLANAALAQRIQPRLEVALQAVRLAAAAPPGGKRPGQLAAGRGGGGGGGRGPPHPPLVLRLAQLPAREPASALRHHRALPHRSARLRRPRRHLPAPRLARQACDVPPCAGPPRAERDVAVPAARRRSDLSLRRARGRPGLQAGGESGRRAVFGLPRRAGARGPARPRSPHQRLVRLAGGHQSAVRPIGKHPRLGERGGRARHRA